MAADDIYIPPTQIFLPRHIADEREGRSTPVEESNDDIYDAAPNSAQQMMVRPSSADLGLLPLSLPEVRKEAATVGFESGFVAVSMIAGRIWDIWQDGAAQLELAREMFGDVEIFRRYQAFRSRYQGSVLFSQQQLFSVQRLLIQHAREATLDEPLTEDEIVSLMRILVAAHDLIDSSHPRLARGEADLIDVVAYTVQSGAYSARSAQLNDFGRAYDLFFTRARALDNPPIPLDEWAMTDTKLTLEEQLGGGFGFHALAERREDAGGARPTTIEPPFLTNTRLGEAQDRLVDALAASRGWFEDAFAEGPQNVRDVAWEVYPFIRRPFLLLESGRIALTSPGAMASWLGFGFYDRLRESAKCRRKKKHDTVSLFGKVYGDLVEDYALDVVKSVFEDGRVHGDYPYGKGGGRRTPDVAIDCGEDLVLIEVRSGFLSPWFRTSGDTVEFTDQLDKLVFSKLNQLDNAIANLKIGTAAIPGVDMAGVERIWPILITADLTITEHLWTLIRGQMHGSLQTDDVQHLVLGDIEDLELLMGLVEEGHGLIDMLRARQESPYVELELKRWVLEDLKASNLTRPAVVVENWKRAADAMNSTLWAGAATAPPSDSE